MDEIDNAVARVCVDKTRLLIKTVTWKQPEPKTDARNVDLLFISNNFLNIMATQERMFHRFGYNQGQFFRAKYI